MCWELNSHTWGSRPQALPQGANRKLNAQENTAVTFVSPQNCRALGSLQSTFSEPPNGPGRWAAQVEVESCQQQAGEPGGIPSRIAQAQDQKQPMFLVQSEGRKGLMSQLKGPQAGWVSLHSRRGNIFALVGSSADWVEPTHTREGHGFTRYVFKCPLRGLFAKMWAVLRETDREKWCTSGLERAESIDAAGLRGSERERWPDLDSVAMGEEQETGGGLLEEDAGDPWPSRAGVRLTSPCSSAPPASSLCTGASNQPHRRWRGPINAVRRDYPPTVEKGSTCLQGPAVCPLQVRMWRFRAENFLRNS